MAHQPSPRRPIHRVAFALLLMLILTGAWVSPAGAFGAPAAASLNDVFSALHLSPQPADYVVIVDTSASMTTDNRYQRVQGGLSRMAQALSPDDRVAVITFDSKPTLRRPLTAVGSNRATIVSSLPATPTGQATDIGMAIGNALDLMQQDKLRSRAAVLLFTDGMIDTDKSSPYATVTSPGWSALKQRASALQSSHDIAPLAIALTSNTDAAVLKQVFSNVTDVSSTDLGSYLGHVSTEVMKAAAINKLKDHLADPVTASLNGVPETAQPDPSPATIALHNTNPLVPVEVTGLAVTAEGGTIGVTGVPPSVTIQPGGNSTIDVTVTTKTAATVTPTRYRLTGTVSTPWQDVITRELRLTWAAKLISSSGQIGPLVTAAPAVTRPAPAKRSASVFPIVAAGLLLLAILIVLAIRLLRGAGGPPLTGTLSLQRNGRPVDERLLRGRRASFHVSDPDATVRLAGMKDKDGRPGVKVHVSAATERITGTLFEGDTLEFADVVVTYTNDRTRMLRLIGTD